MSDSKNNWGGARPGAGRPKIPGRKKVMFFVTENEKDVPYPVFYRVPDAKEAVRILEASGN